MLNVNGHHPTPKVSMTPKMTRDEKIAHVEAYRASGMSQKDYSEVHGIPVASLGYWVKEHRTKWSKDITSRSKFKPLDFPTLPGRGKSQIIKETAALNNYPLVNIDMPRIHDDEPDWRKLYEDEKAKVEALQKVIAVLGFQL